MYFDRTDITAIKYVASPCSAPDNKVTEQSECVAIIKKYLTSIILTHKASSQSAMLKLDWANISGFASLHGYHGSKMHLGFKQLE